MKLKLVSDRYTVSGDDIRNVTVGHFYEVAVTGHIASFKDDFGNSRILGASVFDLKPAVQKLDDPIDHPSHYGGADNPYEAIKVIEAWQLNFNTGNAVKYISRAGKKSPNIAEDMKKAVWYLNREIDNLTKAGI